MNNVSEFEAKPLLKPTDNFHKISVQNSKKSYILLASIAMFLMFLKGFVYRGRVLVEEVSELTLNSCASNFPGTIILGKPTADTINLSIVSSTDLNSVTVTAILRSDNSKQVSSTVSSVQEMQAFNILLTNLAADSYYDYTISYSGNEVQCSTSSHQFHTQRKPGSTFTFAVVADSHLGTLEHCNVDRYRQTLENLNSQLPDFFLTLGDDFRADHIEGGDINNQTVEQLYLNQRPFFSIAAQDSALFNVNGNHELQSGWYLDGTGNNVALWAVNNRLNYFPNPRPLKNGFYTGQSNPQNFVLNGGLLENYYSWIWGDALFVTLDNYYFSKGEVSLGEEGWDISLGIDQFNWLKHVISSEANFKFVFHHHLNGVARGGIEWAGYFEWGGNSPREGTTRSGMIWEFDQKRPGWGGVPIHQLLVANNVDVVFQGHDHLFVKQVHPDGIIYLTVPMPGFDPTLYFNTPMDSSVYYDSGDIIGPSGHISVEVSPNTATFTYVLSRIPDDPESTGINQESVYTFTIQSSKPYR